MSVSLDIAIIGAGQIGSRHLQALAKLKDTVRIQLVDTAPESLEIACKRFYDVYKGDSERITLQQFNSIRDLESDQDLVIVATDARDRGDVIKELVRTKNVRFMILEKVLFQTEEEYYEIDCLLKDQNIPTWVNCVLRATDFYGDLRSTLSIDEPIRMVVEGVSWGLACNSIHFIDLFSFFTDCVDFQFTETALSEKIYDSRRPGYKEFSGQLVGKNSQGHILILSCRGGECGEGGEGGAVSIQIDSGRKKHVIASYMDHAVYKVITQGGEAETTVSLPMQSQITHLLVNDIFKNGTCGLPVYADSMILHLSLIKVLLKQMSEVAGKEIIRCPIT
tara:strand:+ start:897 stop:1901 length:1005 start_codon:yes stop_codon:yes gene_type:complete